MSEMMKKNRFSEEISPGMKAKMDQYVADIRAGKPKVLQGLPFKMVDAILELLEKDEEENEKTPEPPKDPEALEAPKPLVIKETKFKNLGAPSEKPASVAPEDEKRLHDVREELGLDEVENKTEAGNVSLSSIDYPEEIHDVQMVTGPVEGLHYNAAHGQDAYSVQEDGDVLSVTIGDGTSSRKGSGVVSAYLSDKIAKAALTRPLSEIYTPQELKKMLEEISGQVGLINEGGKTTLLSARVDKNKQEIEWASVGDSPLLVVDTDDGGNVRWEMLNEGFVLTSENYYMPDIVDDLKVPLVEAVAIEVDGSVPDINLKIKQGTIPYKRGRKVVLASDFLTKMMIHSPDVAFAARDHWETTTTPDKNTGKPRTDAKRKTMAEAWDKLGTSNEARFKGVWIPNPVTGESMVDPTFFVGKKPEELKAFLDEWCEVNTNSSDDVTMFALDMDKYVRS
jgi:hypothetical protein